MRKTFNDTVVKLAIKFKIDVLNLELNTLKELSETIGVPSTNVGDDLEERLNRLVELADGSDAWEEKVNELQGEILGRINRLVELADDLDDLDTCEERVDDLQEEILERFNHLIELEDGSDACKERIDELGKEILASQCKERRGY